MKMVRESDDSPPVIGEVPPARAGVMKSPMKNPRQRSGRITEWDGIGFCSIVESRVLKAVRPIPIVRGDFGSLRFSAHTILRGGQPSDRTPHRIRFWS